MHPAAYFGAAVLGVFAAIGYVVLTAASRRQHRHENARKRCDESSVRPSRNQQNLTCPFCGLRVGAGDPQFGCGHTYHRLCFFQESDERCGFCYNRNDIIEEQDRTPKPNLRRRIPVASSPHTPQDDRRYEKPRSDVASSSRVDSRSRVQTAPSKDTKLECAYCEISTEMNKAVRLPCHHFAHGECFESFNKIFEKCPKCPET